MQNVVTCPARKLFRVVEVVSSLLDIVDSVDGSDMDFAIVESVQKESAGLKEVSKDGTETGGDRDQ